MATNTLPENPNHSHHHTPTRGPRILLGVTGSVAAVKAPELAVRLVTEQSAEVQILLSQGGKYFWNKAADYDLVYWNQLQQLLITSESSMASNSSGTTTTNDPTTTVPRIRIHDAHDEWQDWRQLGDPVLHIELRAWADLLLIAPLSAHTLGKLAHGFCNDTLTCVARAWDLGHSSASRPGKPLVLAPAMNTAMWEHPLTAQQLQTIRGFWNTTTSSDGTNGIHVIEPATKTLACGEVGVGALASVNDILQVVDGTWKATNTTTTTTKSQGDAVQ